MTIQAKSYSHLVGNLEGFSDEQIEQHIGLYEGYVKKLGEIRGRLAEAKRKDANYSYAEFSELKRREAVAFSGMHLHELYFDALASGGGKPSAGLEGALAASFGGLTGFHDELRACGASTLGWVVLSKSIPDGKLGAWLLTEHHNGLPPLQHILLVMDTWEHAYAIDYGTKKEEYFDAFIANIDWSVADKRFAAAK